MIEIWIRKTRSKNILCLVKFDHFPLYIEIPLFYLRCHKKMKLKFHNLGAPSYYHRHLSKIPEGYEGKKAIFMKGDIIYSHEVVKKVLSKWGK